MSDVFISYTSVDAHLAGFMHRHLENEGLSVFLAPVSIQPAEQWSPAVLRALNESAWVLFLASRAACASPYVQQEIGAAVAGKKELIPVVWDMPASDLPGWAKQYQALDLAGRTRPGVQAEMSTIASRIKAKKTTGLLIAGLLVAGLLAFGTS